MIIMTLRSNHGKTMKPARNRESGSFLEMAVKLLIPGPLRRLAGNRAELALSGGTVREVIEALEKECSGFRGKLIGADGEVKLFIGVFLNGINIRETGGAGTAVKDGDVIELVPAAAGG